MNNFQFDSLNVIINKKISINMRISDKAKDIKYNFIQKQKGDIIAFIDHNWENIVQNHEKSELCHLFRRIIILKINFYLL